MPDEHVVAKLLGRRGCDACGNNYNLADVHDDERGVYMPPILPANADTLKDGELRCDCGAVLSTRADDTAAVISERLEVYHEETAPLIAHYRQRGLLAEYRVRYGVGDMDGLVRTIPPTAQAVNLLASVSSWLWLREGGLAAGRRAARGARRGMTAAAAPANNSC